MLFTCTVELRDPQNSIWYSIAYDSGGIEQVFYSPAAVASIRDAALATVLDISVVSEYIRVVFTANHGVNTQHLAIFIPTDGKGKPLIGRWVPSPDASMSYGSVAICATRPLNSPKDLIDPREIELERLGFVPWDEM